MFPGASVSIGACRRKAAASSFARAALSVATSWRSRFESMRAASKAGWWRGGATAEAQGLSKEHMGCRLSGTSLRWQY